MPKNYTVCSPIDGETYTLSIDPEFGFLRTDPWPSSSDLKRIYKDYDNTTPIFHEFRFLSLLKDHLKILKEPWNICEIGCGNGELLKLLKEDRHNVTGFEPSRSGYETCRAQGLNVSPDFFEPSKFKGRPNQDLFILINLLEHVPDPAELLREIKEHLNPASGYLMILVPNEFNPLQQLIIEKRKIEPYFLAPPIHLSYFNPQSLEKLLVATGFEIVHRTTDFPMEWYLLNGRDYLNNAQIGKDCHQERLKFEKNLYQDPKLFWKFYDSLAQNNLGREIIIVAKMKTENAR